MRLTAKLVRRAVSTALALAFAAALAGCGPPPPDTRSAGPALDGRKLDRRFAALAGQVRPAVLGAGLMSLEDGRNWTFQGDRRFPLSGAADAVIAAAALSEVDAGRLSLAEAMTVREQDLSPPPSAVADAWPGRTAWSAGALLGALAGGDSTAGDILMKRIGGPGAVTGWLQAEDVEEGLRIDRYRRQRLPELSGLASFRPAWRGQTAYAAVVRSIPPQRLRAAMARALADPRDSVTPNAMLTFLGALDRGELVSPASTRLLRTLLERDGAAGRLAGALPRGARLMRVAGTDSTDAGQAAVEAGVITLADGRRYAVAVLLAGQDVAPAARDAALAQASKILVSEVL
jgi:beta-lactamase class A